ncbi:GGDEF domain-containing protein [Thalassotalea mangrovi]|uniref:diguanylate cyclase n=1 Tax=Thalassotalea mangrovi TaxID=2572245 RepID=A0A4U1B2P4_9GAMM|nr:GGDEF domain-containing protein [Thalassotalea mangrovi]TKB43759.1 diguanylate cyclase [Thalassotalea mangrovi]
MWYQRLSDPFSGKKVATHLCLSVFVLIFLYSANALAYTLPDRAKALLSADEITQLQRIETLIHNSDWQQSRQAIEQWQLNADNNPFLKQGLAESMLGEIAMQLNEHQQAKLMFSAARDNFEKINEPALIAMVDNDLGRNYRFVAEYDKAIIAHQQALKTFTHLNDQAGIANQYANLGLIYEYQGRYQESLLTVEKALKINKYLNRQKEMAANSYNIGSIYLDMGMVDTALDYFRDTLIIDQSTGNQKDIAYSNIKLADVYLKMANLSEAQVHASEALKIFNELKTPRDIDWARLKNAEIGIAKGELASAKTTLLDILQSQYQGSQNLKNRVRKSLAKIALQEGDIDKASELTDTVVAYYQSRNQTAMLAALNSMRIEISVASGDYAQAFQLLNDLRDHEKELFSRQKSLELAAFQARTEAVRQAQTIALLQKDNQLSEVRAKQEQQLYQFLYLGVILILGLSFLSWTRWQSKKLNKKLSRLVKIRTKELESANQALQVAYKSAEEASVKDSLTGLNNRRYLEQNLPDDIKSVLSLQQGDNEQDPDLCCLLLDIDHFKQINDNYGHKEGDKILIKIAQILNENARQSDYKVRWGGEEFLLVLRFQQRKQAKIMAERLCHVIEKTEFLTEAGDRISVTCSIGFVSFPVFKSQPESVSWSKALEIADHCLYAAKHSGRNAWMGAHGSDNKSMVEIASVTGLEVESSF